MNKKIKSIRFIQLLFLLSGVMMWGMGCSNKSREKVIDEVQTEELPGAVVNPGEVAGVTVGYGDEEMLGVELTDTDLEKLTRQIATLRYDTAWNNRGIMVKMVVPDYTLILNYKDRTLEESDWLMFWKAEGRTKFRNEWYVLPESERELTYTLVESFRSQVN